MICYIVCHIKELTHKGLNAYSGWKGNDRHHYATDECSSPLCIWHYICACIWTISFPDKSSLYAVLKNVSHNIAAAPSAFPEIYLIEYYIMHLEVYIVE